MKKAKTVKRIALSTIRMVTGNEKKHPTVIMDGTIKDWVGFGWVTLGKATTADKKLYPIVID